MNRISAKLLWRSVRQSIRKNAPQVLISIFGVLQLSTIVGVIWLILTLDWFSGAVNEWFDSLGKSVSPGLKSWDYAKLFIFPMTLLSLVVYSRKASRHLKTRIDEIEEPRRVRAIVMFLSLPGSEDQAAIEELIRDGGWITDKTTLKKFNKSWRMPLEAISYHLYKLEDVIVIPSEETQSDFKTFRDLVTALTPSEDPSGKPRLNVQSPQDLGIVLSKPLDFESVKQQNDVLNKVLDHLTETRRFKRKDIIIDVTGGKKVSSAAGTVVALGKGWRFQYVSQDDQDKYTVREYDVTIEIGDTNA